MKNLLTLLLSIGVVMTSYSQEAINKKVNAGIVIGGDLNINSPQTNTINSKTGGDLLAGMILDWSFLKNIALSTGLEFEFNYFRTTFNETVYFDYNDKDVLRKKDITEGNEKNRSFLVTERKHKNVYLSLPVMLKFQTNYMGYFRYYGKFGIRNSFLLMTRANNDGIGYDGIIGNDSENIFQGLKVDGTKTLDDMKNPSALSFYKGSIGLTAGAEYNIAGNTVLMAELGYYYGISEVFRKGAIGKDKDKKSSLYNITEHEEQGNTIQHKEYYTPSLKQSQLMLKVAVLF